MSRRPFDQPIRARYGRENRLSADRAREGFFEVVERLAPECRESLQHNVWPAYQKTLAALAKRGAIRNRRDAFYFPLPHDHLEVVTTPWGAADAFVEWYRRACESKDPAVRPLRRALDAWVKRFNVDADWIQHAAIRSIRVWEQHPKRADEPTWYPPWARETPGVPATRIEALVPLPLLGDLLSSLPSDLRKEHIRHFTEDLDLHLAELKKQARDLGLPVAVKKLGMPIGVAEFQHLHVEWLVRYQVLSEAADAIAKQFKRDRRTIDEAVRGLAAQLGLRLRPRRSAGRPRGAKTRTPIHY